MGSPTGEESEGVRKEAVLPKSSCCSDDAKGTVENHLKASKILAGVSV
jgi:hypothetical protein